MSWTVRWDVKRRDGSDCWCTALAQTEAGALERAQHFIRLGFVVYAIRDPQGGVFMDEAHLAERFGKATPHVRLVAKE